MRLYYSILVLSGILIFKGVSAQHFATNGAKWYYTQVTENSEVFSFKTIEPIYDTVIAGRSCIKLSEVERYFDTTNIYYHYCYSSHDSVYFYDPASQNFYLLYNFGAEAGDTITLDHYTIYNGDALKMIVDSTGILNINGRERKIQYVTSGDGISIEFGGIIIEDIGNLYYMFPIYDMNKNGPLRCYYSDSLGLFKNTLVSNPGWHYQDCEEIITGIGQVTEAVTFELYPNPVVNRLIAVAQYPIDISYIYIYSSEGLLCYSMKVGRNSTVITLNLESLKPGLYLVGVKSKEKEYMVGKFIKVWQ